MNFRSEFILTKNKTDQNKTFRHIDVEKIPICDKCLYEIKLGEFLCDTCKTNICYDHLKGHLGNHEIFKLKLNK